MGQKETLKWVDGKIICECGGIVEQDDIIDSNEYLEDGNGWKFGYGHCLLCDKKYDFTIHFDITNITVSE